MIDVFKAFYTIHYNFAAVSILLLALNIFLLTKKNFKWTIVFTAVLIAFNVFIFKRTEGKSWTIYIDPPEDAGNSFYKPEPTKMTFSIHKDWVIVDDKAKSTTGAGLTLIGISSQAWTLSPLSGAKTLARR